MQFCSAVANKAVNLGQWVAAASAGQLWSQPVNISDLFNPGKECITNAAVTDADAKHAAGSQRNPCNLQLVVAECQTVISKLVPSVHLCRWLSALCCIADNLVPLAGRLFSSLQQHTAHQLSVSLDSLQLMTAWSKSKLQVQQPSIGSRMWGLRCACGPNYGCCLHKQ